MNMGGPAVGLCGGAMFLDGYRRASGTQVFITLPVDAASGVSLRGSYASLHIRL
jgi:hypothetical protein